MQVSGGWCIVGKIADCNEYQVEFKFIGIFFYQLSELFLTPPTLLDLHRRRAG